MSIGEAFEQAQVDAKELAQRPSDDVLLRLYALYKQGTHGDAGDKRPGVFDLVGRAKYDAWKALAGTATEDAQQRYVALVQELRAG
jgi:acyl-CoA-binding protein